MSILFVNGSPNKNGNTAKLAGILLAGKAYKTLELADYKVYGYGQNFEDDQFAEIVDEMKAADTIVIGSPVYWHNMSGMIRNLLDRFYGPVEEGEKACIFVPGYYAGRMDAGKSGVYYETLCKQVWYGIHRNGSEQI